MSGAAILFIDDDGINYEASAWNGEQVVKQRRIQEF